MMFEYMKLLRDTMDKKLSPVTIHTRIPYTLTCTQKVANKYLSYLPNPSARAGYDTRSIFKRSLTGLNSEFSFS